MTVAVAQVVVESHAVKQPTALDLISGASERYIGAFIEARWGKNGSVGRSLRFNANAMARVGQIFGWIHGLSFKDRPLAESLASDFILRMDRLSDYGGEFGDRPDEQMSNPKLWSFHIPRYLIQICDDGCFGSFSICWYCGVPQSEAERAAEPKAGWVKDDRQWAPHYWYAFSFNGGFIFHGPNDLADLKPGSYYWSIHT